MKIKKVVLGVIVVGIVVLCTVAFLTDFWHDARAADHAEAPASAHDAAADIADVYLFLDPNNDSQHTNVILIMTLHGFVAPQENVNLGFFDPNVLHRFELETTGDAKPDEFIDVQFAPRTATSTGQVATIKLPNRQSFTAVATRSSLADSAPAPILTTNADGVVFFAGLTDDPFFFDIPAFNRFVASGLGGAPDSTVFLRGRDSFAGYNIPAIALSIPVALIQPESSGSNTLGMSGRTFRRVEMPTAKGDFKSTGVFRTVDRMGVPAVNTAFIPFASKNRYNAAKTTDDAQGEFAPSIVATLTALGTTPAYINILASVAVAKGDILRLNLTIPNSGIGRGLPPTVEDAFPNGRRLHDDVIDILLTLVANGNQLGDNVDGNDVPFRAVFPFLAPSHQPRANGVDDNTRN